MERKITLLDNNLTQRMAFDEQNQAQRVVIVGGEMPTFNVESASSQEVRIEKIEVPVIVKEVQIVEVEKIIYLYKTEVVEIEVPTIVIQEVIKEVIREVPVIQHEIEIIEKPVVIHEVEFKEISNLVKVFLAVNSLATITLLIKLIFK